MADTPQEMAFVMYYDVSGHQRRIQIETKNYAECEGYLLEVVGVLPVARIVDVKERTHLLVLRNVTHIYCWRTKIGIDDV